MSDAPIKTRLEKAQEDFPVGRKVRFNPGHGADDVVAKVTGHRTSGEVGTRSFSVFIETEEDLGADRKPKKRAARPGTCTLVA